MNQFTSKIRGRVADQGMYARVDRHGRVRESAPASVRGSLLFVDLDVREVTEDALTTALAHARFLAPVALGNISTMIVRWPETRSGPGPNELAPVFEKMAWLTERLPLRCSGAIAACRVGELPTLTWGTGTLGRSPDDFKTDDEVLAQCRAIELSSLLINGHALWNPDRYHYRLPSGRHSATFVRIADAIRSLRDAEVLAWWLLHQAENGVGVVIDSSTVLPMVLSLEAMMAEVGIRLGRTEVLSSYPATTFDFARTVRSVADAHNSILGLLSVSSSGSVQRSFVDAMSAASLAGKWSIQTLVDKQFNESVYTPPGLGAGYERVSVWLGLGDAGESLADSCNACSDPERSRIVHIDPSSFDGLVLPEPHLLTPDIRFADESRLFWEACDAADALALDAQAHETAAHVRPQNSVMGVRVDFDPLLVAADLDDGPEVERHGDLLDLLRGQLAPVQGVDVVLAPKDELNRADQAGRRLAQRLFADLTPGAVVLDIDFHASQSADTVEAVREASRIGLFTLGVVTGTSLHRLLSEVSAIRREAKLPAAEIEVFVGHIRPHSERAMETIVNPFGERQFHAAFASYLPDATSPSPLRDEVRVLQSLPDSAATLDAEAGAFLGDRLAVLRGGQQTGLTVFWGISDADAPANRLRPGSLYGESLTSLSAFVAVGSAVHRRRETARRGGAPEWRQFDIPAITKSYFDPLIVCSIFRWLRPEECWWGREQSQSVGVVEEFLGGYRDNSELRVVVSELLLAAAQGKVPKPAIPTLIDRGEALLDQIPLGSGSLRLALEIGRRFSDSPNVTGPLPSQG